MSNEIVHNYLTSKTLYFCIFNRTDGKVFRTGTTTAETWGTAGRTAADYDEPLAESTVGASMHYIGTFTASLPEATYDLTIFDRATGTPLDADIAIAQGEFFWDGTAEITLPTMSDILAVIDNTTNRIVIDDTTDGAIGTATSTSSVAGKNHDC